MVRSRCAARTDCSRALVDLLVDLTGLSPDDRPAASDVADRLVHILADYGAPPRLDIELEPIFNRIAPIQRAATNGSVLLLSENAAATADAAQGPAPALLPSPLPVQAELQPPQYPAVPPGYPGYPPPYWSSPPGMPVPAYPATPYGWPPYGWPPYPYMMPPGYPVPPYLQPQLQSQPPAATSNRPAPRGVSSARPRPAASSPPAAVAPTVWPPALQPVFQPRPGQPGQEGSFSLPFLPPETYLPGQGQVSPPEPQTEPAGEMLEVPRLAAEEVAAYLADDDPLKPAPKPPPLETTEHEVSGIPEPRRLPPWAVVGLMMLGAGLGWLAASYPAWADWLATIREAIGD
jgi:hypothetical protein